MSGLQGPQGLPPGQNQAAGMPGDLECDFYMYLFKVHACPKRGAHDWSSCPYAHPKEKARRRDPRVYKYASTPCPESLQGVSCGRGVDCPYAHSVYEYWLHPARFRTQMCKKGNQCNRTLCFFAHSAADLRFPDTDDEVQAAAVDAAAASATAGPLPLCHPGLSQHAGLAMMQSAAGSSNNSLPLMNIGSVCSDASAATAVMAATVDGSSGSYNMAAYQAAGMRQGSGASQLTGVVDDMSGSYGLGGSDPGLLLQGLANSQPQQQPQQQQHQQVGASSLSEPLPRMGSDASSLATAAWLQLATASQLPASQILNSIRPPGASSVAAQQAAAQQRQVMQQVAAGYGPLGQAGPKHQAQLHGSYTGTSAALNSNLMLLSGGSGSSSHPLAQPCMGNSAEQLVAGLSGLQLQGGSLVDDGSGGLASAASASALADRYAGLTAAAASGRAVDASMLQGAMAADRAGQAANSRSRAEDFLLLQLLQEKQIQQQQQQQQQQPQQMTGVGSGQTYHNQMPAGARQQRGKLNWSFGFGS